ncbi:MAG: hypothetical protein LBH08_03640 [Puniceicoccales bacterium]|jgi:hypothetical protein|nr:hypothetical protein [Puniceicoccales bacterium]
MKDSDKVKIISTIIASTLNIFPMNQTALASFHYSPNTINNIDLSQKKKYLEDAIARGEVHLFADSAVMSFVLLDRKGNLCSLPIRNVASINLDLINDDHCHILPQPMLSYVADASETEIQRQFYNRIMCGKFMYRLNNRKIKLLNSIKNLEQLLIVLQDQRQDEVSITFNYHTGQFQPCANVTMLGAAESVYKVILPSSIYRRIVSQVNIDPNNCIIYDQKQKIFKAVEWNIAIDAIVAVVWGTQYAYTTADQWERLPRNYYEMAKGTSSTIWEKIKNFVHRIWDEAKNVGKYLAAYPNS